MEQQLVPFETIMSMGEVFASSGYFTDAKERSQAVVKILAGQEMGVGPFASMSGIHIIKGKPEVGAHLLAAVLRKSGKYTYEVEQPIKPDRVTLEFFERGVGPKGWKSLGKSTFTAEDARKAGTGNMQKYPRNMLFARALSNGVKWYCPDVSLSPLYSRGELDEAANAEYETGEIIDTTATEFPQQEPQPRQEPTEHTLVDEKPEYAVGNQGQREEVKTKRPWGADTLRTNLLKRTGQLRGQGDEWQIPPAEGVVGALTGKLNGILGDDDRRHTFLRFVFGDPSTKQMDKAQVQSIFDWIGGEAGMEIVTNEAHRLVNGIVTQDAVGELPGMDAKADEQVWGDPEDPAETKGRRHDS